MNTMKWLIKREFWEHRGLFLWFPVIAVGLLIGLVLVSKTVETAICEPPQCTINIGPFMAGKDGPVATAPSSLQRLVRNFGRSDEVAKNYLTYATPLILTLYLTMVSYLASALYAERKDGSVLFWRSLPVGDSATVIAKTLTALVVAPLVTYTVAIVGGAILLVIHTALGLMAGLPLESSVLAYPDTYLSALALLASIPIFALWALPMAGVLLVAGAKARNYPLLWVFGGVLTTGGTLAYINTVRDIWTDTQWYWNDFAARLALGGFPYAWFFSFQPLNPSGLELSNRSILEVLLIDSCKYLASPSLWIGAVGGVCLIWIAIQFRRRNN